GILEMSLTLAHERYVGVKLPPRGQSALGRPGGAQTGAPATTIRFALAAPAREPSHLLAVLRERLARVTLPATVESIVLASEVTASLASRNLGFLSGGISTAA